MNDAGLKFVVSSSLDCDVNKDAAAIAFVIEVVNNIRLDLKTCRLELEDFKTKKNPLTKLPTLRFLRKFYAFTQRFTQRICFTHASQFVHIESFYFF